MSELVNEFLHHILKFHLQKMYIYFVHATAMGDQVEDPTLFSFFIVTKRQKK